MFETSVVRARAAAAPRRMGLLTASLAFHSIVVLAAVMMTISSVGFPQKAPDEISFYRVAPVPAMPPAQGTPHPAPPRPAQPQQQTGPRPVPTAAITAPAVVPDTVTPAAAATATGDASATDAAAGTGEGRVGVPWGDPNGIGTGDPGAGPAPGTVLQPGGEVKPAVVLSRIDPIYPRVAQAMHLDGTVVVQCIIGKDGMCRHPEILMSTHQVFNQAATDAVQRWTFAPGTYRGQVVDTYFQLTIKFHLN